MIHFLNLNSYLRVLAENHLLRRLNAQDIYRSDIDRKIYDEFLLIEVVLLKNKLIQTGAVFLAVSALMVLLTKMQQVDML